MIKSGITAIMLVSMVFSQALAAQTAPDTLTYTRQEILIPMRDGIKLNTVIYAPKDAKESLPFLFLRTPYGVSGFPSPNNRAYISDLARDGYIFVFQDIRGRYKSEGVFVMQRPVRDKGNPAAIDESTDTYDTIDWLLANVPGNNGKAGMLGISYDGWTTMMGTLDPHPALKAASEQASPSDMYLGDDFHHNGAFRLSYGFEYAYLTEHSKQQDLFPFGTYDTYEWYLALGPLSNINEKYLHGTLPTWNDFVKHPNYDDFWKIQSMAYRLSTPTVPILHVAGWWDQEDFYGPLKAYEVLEKADQFNKNFIVIGPWNHGGWGGGTGSSLGRVDFASPTSVKFRKDIQAPFFSHYLKGVGHDEIPEALTFQTGTNAWKSYAEWPPVSSTAIRNLYFNSDGRLSFVQPKDKDASDGYLSDPFHPVPYRPRPIEMTYGPGSRWFTWLVEDQRFVDDRPDVVSWETDVLEGDVEVTGNLSAVLFAATTGTDADWVVKLIDVYPQAYPEKPTMAGYELMIANDVFRGRFRKSFSDPEPVKPNEVNRYTIDLHSVNHVFKAGHKIMVQVQSSWFPLIDRNPQTYVPNIFEAKESDFIVTHQKIYRSERYPSHIELPVVK